MKVVVLCALIISNGFYEIAAMPDLAKWTEDEIGERWVGRIREILKDPFMALLATSEFTTKKELRRRIASAQDALKQFKDLIEEEIGLKSTVTVQPEQATMSPAAAAPVMPVVAMASIAQAPTPMAMPAVNSMAPSMPEAAVAVAPPTSPVAQMLAASPAAAPAQVQPAVVATPTVAEELMSTAPAELMAPGTELMTMPIAAPEQSPATMAQNDSWIDDKPLESLAEKFDELAIAELDQSALELIPLEDDESSAPTPRFVKDAMAEKMPKIQVIHDQNVMNSI